MSDQEMDFYQPLPNQLSSCQQSVQRQICPPTDCKDKTLNHFTNNL